MNINDLSTAQIKAIVQFREEFADVQVWPSGDFGVVLVKTNSAGVEAVSRLARDGVRQHPFSREWPPPLSSLLGGSLGPPNAS